MKEVQKAEALRLADECDESATHWVHEIDTRFKAAKMLRDQHARIEELEAELEAVGAGGVEPLRKQATATQTCSRSHPHEEMTPMCELRTEIARLTNALARAEAAAPQAVQAAVPGDVVSDLKNALADATELRQQLRLMEDHARGEVWRWQTDAENDLASMGNRMGVLIYAADLRNLLSAPAHPAEGEVQ